jgi:hypothetical protein
MPRRLRPPPPVRRAAAFLLPLAALPGCATVARENLVYIDVGGDNDCVVEAGGRRFALPGGEAGLAAHLHALAAQAGGALMGPRPARTSPGCWDAAIALALHAGFARIGYFSESPAPGEVVG